MSSLNHWPPEAWLLWAVLAVISFAFDLALPSFYLFFVGFSAAVTAAVSLKLGWTAQIGTFMVTAFLSVFVVRPKLLARLHSDHTMPSRTTRLVGVKGVISEAVNPVENRGRVMVEGHDWLARCDRPLPVGTEVLVEGHEGITLLVKEI